MPAHPDAIDRILIVRADLLKIAATAIVNAANTELWLGGGVAGAIAAAGGPTIETEAMSQGPIAVGQAVITRSGKLAQSGILYIIHAATMAPGEPSSPALVAQATFSALDAATTKRIPTIAFPALGTGAGGVSFAECAMAMLSTMVDYCGHNEFPRRIHIACYEADCLAAFQGIATGLRRTATR